MRGEVEIWDGDKLLHREPNMLVDGAGELLAEVMTVSPSLSGQYESVPSASSILDASNYTIQAISFGTGSDAYNKVGNTVTSGVASGALVSTNAQALDEKKIDYLVNGAASNYFRYGATVVVLHELASQGGSYYPQVGLPEAPDPSLKVLAKNTNVSATFAGSGVSSDVSSIFPGNGQHVNFLPSGIGSAMMENTEFSDTSSLQIAQSVLGAFPEGSSVNLVLGQDHVTPLLFNYPISTNTLYELDVFGFFNEVSSMDVSGFVNMVMSGSPGTTTDYAMSSGASGLCVSGGHDSTNSGTVEYTVMLAAGDVKTSNMYGGIYHLGLWTIDMKESLLNGNTPPFGFSVLNNPRKYKLFARKGMSKNICQINDDPGVDPGRGLVNYKDLTIKWRLHFL